MIGGDDNRAGARELKAVSLTSRSRALRALIGIATLAVIAAASPPASSAQAPAAGAVNLHLLALNDFHGGIEPRTLGARPAGGTAALAAHFAQRRARYSHTLAVHAGDVIGASPPISNLLREEPSITSMDLLGVELGAVGNHEFDRGLAALRRLQHGGCDEAGHCFPGARMQYLAANVIDEAADEPVFPATAVRTVDGILVGFIGVTLRETPTIVTSAGTAGLRFPDEVATINAHAAGLKAEGVRAIVVLLHHGGRGTPAGGAITGADIIRIAQGTDPEVDVIVSGHTHQGYRGTIAGKLITQAFSGGTAFADIDLDLDRATGDVTRKRAEIVTAYADTIQPDPAVAAQVAAWQEQVRPIVERVVATAATTITRAESRAGESALGNLIADAMRAAMASEIACMNEGGIRADLPAGEVTYGRLLTIQPFANDLVRLTLTGDQLVRLLNQQWADQSRPLILKCSGIRYTWDAAQPPESRVALADVSLDDGAPIAPTARYTLTVNSFIADGGDNYTVLTEGADREVGPVDVEALAASLAALPQPIQARIEGRITVRNAGAPAAPAISLELSAPVTTRPDGWHCAVTSTAP